MNSLQTKTHFLFFYIFLLPQLFLATGLAYFSENSIRRDPRGNEARAIARAPGCTGFFVANRTQKFFLATARHCFAYEMTRNCHAANLANGFMPVALLASGDAAIAYCKRVVAGTRQDDMVIIELEFQDVFQRYANPEKLAEAVARIYQGPVLSLASFTLPTYSQLQMIGYPADTDRRGMLTVTERCWETSGVGKDFFTNLPTARLGGNVGVIPIDPTLRSSVQELNRELRWHNCSVYGGNSGGPILLYGTRIAVGIPAAYHRQSAAVFSYQLSTFYESTAGFVRRNRSALDRAGIHIEEQIPRELIQAQILETQEWIRRNTR